MQRLTRRDDKGSASLYFVLLMVLMVGAMSLAIDGGNIISNKQSDQNSADAAALAIALSCAAGQTCAASVGLPYVNPGGSTPTRSGQTLTATFPAPGTVTATVTKDLKTIFGGAIGVDQGTTQRSATAKWGALGSATNTFPFTISTCAFTIEFNVKVTLHSHNTPGCSNPAGQFGFVKDGCTAQTILAGQLLPGTTGNNLGGTGCSDASLDNLLGTDVLVPVWDTASGQGSGARYHVLAYAVFHLTGWSTNGNAFGSQTHNPPSTLKKQCDSSADGGTAEHDNTPCIRGIFKGYSTESGTVVPGLTCKDNLLVCLVYLDH